MSSIPEYMTTKHRECDEFFSEAEAAVADKDWSLALAKWQLFASELTEHLAQEEDTLFPTSQPFSEYRQWGRRILDPRRRIQV